MSNIRGINRRFYPAQASILGHVPFMPGVDQSENPPPTVAVLVEGDVGDYACYVGHGTPEWVRDHGDKISFREATCHFSGLVEERYRA